jgi:hypothetical protein
MKDFDLSPSVDYSASFDIGMGLCIIGFVLAVAQMFTYCCVNKDDMSA